jgi:hypothetical protein
LFFVFLSCNNNPTVLEEQPARATIPPNSAKQSEGHGPGGGGNNHMEVSLFVGNILNANQPIWNCHEWRATFEVKVQQLSYSENIAHECQITWYIQRAWVPNPQAWSIGGQTCGTNQPPPLFSIDGEWRDCKPLIPYWWVRAEVHCPRIGQTLNVIGPCVFYGGGINGQWECSAHLVFDAPDQEMIGYANTWDN